MEADMASKVRYRKCPECGFGRSLTTYEAEHGGWCKECWKCGHKAYAKTKAEVERLYFEPIKKETTAKPKKNVTAKQKTVEKPKAVQNSASIKPEAKVNEAKTESVVRQYIRLGAELLDKADFCFTVGARRPLFKSQVWFDIKCLAYKHDIILKIYNTQYMSDGNGFWQLQSRQFMNAGPKFTPDAMLYKIKQANGRAGIYGLSDSVYDEALEVEAIASSCQDWKFCLGKPSDKTFKK